MPVASIGLSNIFPQKIVKMIEDRRKDTAINTLIEEILKFPVTPGVKAILALKTKNDMWLNVRPPLIQASKWQIASLKQVMKIDA